MIHRSIRYKRLIIDWGIRDLCIFPIRSGAVEGTKGFMDDHMHLSLTIA